MAAANERIVICRSQGWYEQHRSIFNTTLSTTNRSECDVYYVLAHLTGIMARIIVIFQNKSGLAMHTCCYSKHLLPLNVLNEIGLQLTKDTVGYQYDGY